MSEQTPNSSGDLSGAEPSMEDILASIRKIISEDEPVALESPEDVPTVSLIDADTPDALDDLMQDIHVGSNDLTSDAVIEAAVVAVSPAVVEANSVDLNIDDVLAGLDGDVLGFEPETVELAKSDMDASGAPELEAFETLTQPIETDTLDLDGLLAAPSPVESSMPEAELEPQLTGDDDNILDFLNGDIAEETESVTIAADAASNSDTASGDLADDLEMDALLDDILLSPAELEAEAEFETEDAVQASASTSVEVSSDLDLVKSLMADLADDPEGFETAEELDALLAIPDVEETVEIDIEAAPEPEIDSVEAEAASLEGFEPEPEEDILGDILDMTLEDELQSHPDDIASAKDDDLEFLGAVVDAEQENIAENAVSDTDYMDDDLPSLSEIAAAAEADAAAVETAPGKMAMAPQAVAATAGLGAVAGLTALGTTALGETPAEAETQTAETYSEPEILTESTPTQETSMPVQAVKTDAILDDVTEAATAGAFAELNQVVEDKAIFNERGPRIGDLVQEALRPMLKEWLDANLKGIVERAVAKEVKRISSGK